MTKLTTMQSINPAQLHEGRYLETLLQAAYANRMIDDRESLRIQQKLLQFVKDFANRFVGGMSSSLPVEQVQSLAESALYQIGFYLKSLQDPEQALTLLQAGELSLLQRQGCKLLNAEVEKGRNLLARIQRERIKIPHIAYQDTVMKGLPLFFSEYDVEYAAHETPGSIDYPLAIEIEYQTGIAYIMIYLRQLDLENQFCRHFSPVRIHRLFQAFSEQYEVLLFNQFEQLLQNTIACTLAGVDPLDLFLTVDILSEVIEHTNQRSEQEVIHASMEAGRKLMEQLSIRETTLHKLIFGQIHKDIPHVLNAREHGSLDKIWLAAPCKI